MDTPENIRILADSVLLDLVRRGVEAAQNWSEPVFEALARRDYENALSEFPEARAFAIAVDELTLRAEKIEHETREGLLSSVYPLPDHLRPARAFFARLAPELDRVRELEMYWKNNEAARKRDAELGIVRLTISCFAKDAERIREFARRVNQESKFDKVPKRTPGRPPKPGSPADLKRRAEAEAAAAAAAEAAAAAAAKSTSMPTPGFVDHETEISKWTVFRKPGGGAGEA